MDVPLRSPPANLRQAGAMRKLRSKLHPQRRQAHRCRIVAHSRNSRAGSRDHLPYCIGLDPIFFSSSLAQPAFFSKLFRRGETMGSFAEPKAMPRGTVQVTSHVPTLGPNIRITPQARYYAVAELCRRAGIPQDFFRTWKATVTLEQTTFEISNGTRKYITFPHASPRALKALAGGQLFSANLAAAARSAGSDRGQLSFCTVPFVASESGQNKPLFFLADEHHLQCALDLPLAILLTLSLWEETLEAPRDTHGRLPAKHSAAGA